MKLRLLLASLIASLSAQEIVSTQQIWSAAPHCAFTDLIRFQERWYCAFREGDCHAGGENGKIRVIESDDGSQWESVALLQEEGIDLRDPHFSVTPDGQLMMIYGGVDYGPPVVRQSRVCFSSDGRSWGPSRKVLAPHEWLWRVTWHEGCAYGISYRAHTKGGRDWEATLFKSIDGVTYEAVTKLEVTCDPSEATIRFQRNGEMVALVRRKGNAWVGKSSAPYTDWKWLDAGAGLGGPNFLILPSGQIWVGGRMVVLWPKTVVAPLTDSGFGTPLVLPSGGDTSYPGMVYHEGFLWVSYYTSDAADRSKIYLSKLKVEKGPN